MVQNEGCGSKLYHSLAIEILAVDLTREESIESEVNRLDAIIFVRYDGEM